MGATGYVRATARRPVLRGLAQTGSLPAAWTRQAVRDRASRHIANRQVAGLVAALVVGDQGARTCRLGRQFRATGAWPNCLDFGPVYHHVRLAAAALVGWLWRRSARLCLRAARRSSAAFSVAWHWRLRTVLRARACPRNAPAGCWQRWASCAWRACAGPGAWLLAGAVVVAADPWALLCSRVLVEFCCRVLFAVDPGRACQDQGIRHTVWQRESGASCWPWRTSSGSSRWRLPR